MANFKELGVHPNLVKRLVELEIQEPTEIQLEAIPYLIGNGADFIGQAQTGTGKTAAYGLPLLQQIDLNNKKIQALILVPTRELGQQIAKEIFKFSKHFDKIFVESVFGGAKIENQISALTRTTHIVVATPGRLIDLVRRKAIDIRQVKTVVLDEADEMLSRGFKDELDNILDLTIGRKATWLFSATMPAGIKAIIANYMSLDAKKVTVDKKNIVNRNISHQYVICRDNEKQDLLVEFLRSRGKERGVIFCKTKATVRNVTEYLKAKKIKADAIYGDLLQKERDKVMRMFIKENVQFLVASDMAARGIDVKGLSFVVHYNLPDQLEYYTHRSGRTARAGKNGVSLSIVTKDDLKKLKYIESKLSIAFDKIK